jgi:hypothetical protein
MNGTLNASAFAYSILDFNAEFENICVQIIMCYNLMIDEKVSIPDNENKIRNELVNNYLMNNTIRAKINLTEYRFEREVPEKNDDGRVDIKIVSQSCSFIDINAYYIIECKRLDNKNQTGKTGLNGEYVSNGIARFVSGKYSTYKDTSGMIGFVVSQMDIHENVGFINQLLRTTFTDINTDTELTKKQITPDFEYSYFSGHNIGNVTKTIYHLMFDFSGNVGL